MKKNTLIKYRGKKLFSGSIKYKLYSAIFVIRLLRTAKFFIFFNLNRHKVFSIEYLYTVSSGKVKKAFKIIIMCFVFTFLKKSEKVLKLKF